MNYKITELTIYEASRGLIVEAMVSIPTKRQYTNETVLYHNTDFLEIKPTKSTLKALWRFRRGLRKRVKILQSIEGDFDPSTTNFAKGIFVN